MTQEEFYIWLLNYDSNSDVDLPEFNSEFLKNYEITKLFLDKVGINLLIKEEQKYLNLEAVSSWFVVSRFIRLEYDVPEILELLPERTIGVLDLRNSQIQSLPELEFVGGSLDLEGSQIQSLPKLESVRWNLYLPDSQIKSLPKLESVGGDLFLENSQIQSLPKLESVKYGIVVGRHKVDYWRNYFNETGRSHLANKVCHD